MSTQPSILWCRKLSTDLSDWGEGGELCDPVCQVTLRCAETVFNEKLYTPLNPSYSGCICTI